MQTCPVTDIEKREIVCRCWKKISFEEKVMSKTKENVVGKAVYAFNRKVFCDGMRDGFPIALGYFAVSFSLGIAARKAGLTPLQGFFASLFNNASAGEYAAFTLIAAHATYLEVAIKCKIFIDELCTGAEMCTGHAILSQTDRRL